MKHIKIYPKNVRNHTLLIRVATFSNSYIDWDVSEVTNDNGLEAKNKFLIERPECSKEPYKIKQNSWSWYIERAETPEETILRLANDELIQDLAKLAFPKIVLNKSNVFIENIPEESGLKQAMMFVPKSLKWSKEEQEKYEKFLKENPKVSSDRSNEQNKTT